MKRITFLLVVLCTFCLTAALAQDDKEKEKKKPLSPKETVTGKIDDVNITIVYGRPSARGRKMLGGNEPYGQVWRTGANEATTIEFSKPVKIEGKDLPAGKYALFTIPGEKDWTIIFNKEHKQWGAYNYKQGEDALRVNVKAKNPKSFVETLTIKIDKNDIVMQWENAEVAFKVKG